MIIGFIFGFMYDLLIGKLLGLNAILMLLLAYFVSLFCEISQKFLSFPMQFPHQSVRRPRNVSGGDGGLQCHISALALQTLQEKVHQNARQLQHQHFVAEGLFRSAVSALAPQGLANGAAVTAFRHRDGLH